MPANIGVNLTKNGSEKFENNEGPFSSAVILRPGEQTNWENRNLIALWYYKVLPDDENI